MRIQSQTRTSVRPDEVILETVGALIRASGVQETIEAVDLPLYVTDADGWLTHFNRACVDFAGRTPVSGEDRWCVSWRLRTEGGAPLAHAECPMAVAIREQRPVRGEVAIAERPDGSRVVFAPYPTPVEDDSGRLLGAINLLIDLGAEEQSAALKPRARRCRRLAESVTDGRTVETLIGMAEEYEDKARAINPAPAQWN